MRKLIKKGNIMKTKEQILCDIVGRIHAELKDSVRYNDALTAMEQYANQLAIQQEPRVSHDFCGQYEKLIEVLIDLLYEDPHNWSARPCPTCRVITTIAGKPFGCDKKRELSKNAG